MDSSVSRAWNKDASAGYFVVVGTRDTGFPMTWTNHGAGAMPSLSGNRPTHDIHALHAHFDIREGTNVSDSLKTGRLHWTHFFNDAGALRKTDVGYQLTTETKKTVAYGYENAFSCAAYCGYTSLIPPSAINAHVVDFGKLAGGASPGFPTRWVDYNVDELFKYLASPASYKQRPLAKQKVLLAGLKAHGNSFTAAPRPGTYARIHEIDRGAYAMANLGGLIGTMPWKLNLGIRYTKTHSVSGAFSLPLLAIRFNPADPSQGLPKFGKLSPISSGGSYDYWLPSLNFRLNLRRDLVLRAAYSKTLTRPSLGNLSAAKSFNFRPGSQTESTGNPGLKPYLSKNYDLGLEWYFGKASYLSVDAFLKKVSNFSTLVTTNIQLLGRTFQLTQPVNLNKANVKGAEFTFNDHFTWLPSPFDGLGVATNYTYVTSSASLSGVDIIKQGKFAIPGIGDSYNATLYYQKGPFQARLAYNWRQGYLVSIAGAQGQPTSAEAYGEVDFSGSYDINKHVQIFLDAININNEMVRQYQVFHNRPYFVQSTGRTVLLGVRMKL